MFGQRKSYRPRPYVPRVERLGDRIVPACSVSFAAPRITILCDANPDNVQLSSSGPNTKILYNGQPIMDGQGNFATTANTTEIWVDGQGSGDTINCGNLTGFTGATTLYGGTGNDTILGSPVVDSIFGQSELDSLLGNAGNDTIKGASGNDRIWGDDGEDWLYGDGDDDVMDGGKDNDKMFGGEGVDIMYGNVGNDSLEGEGGTDRLFGYYAGIDDPTGEDTLKRWNRKR